MLDGLFRILGVVAGVALLLAIARTMWIMLRQHRYVFRPGDRNISRYPSDVGLAYEPFSIPVGKQDVITGWYVPGKAGLPMSGVHILFCHGNTGNIGNLVEVALVMTALGFTMVLFDYRGYGASSGKPGEDETYADAEACYRYLVEMRGISPASVVWFGHSLGGSVACQAAPRCPAGALVLEGVFASIPELAARRHPRLPVKPFCRIHYDNLSRVAEVKMPILVAHSREDHICPFEQGRQVFRAAKDPKKFVEIGGGHNNGGVLTNPVYRDEIVAFIKEFMKNDSLWS